MKNFFNNIFKIATKIFSGLLFTALIFAAFTLVTSRTGVLGGMRSFVVLSGSMQPAISVGSIIYTIAQPTYEFNDVVSFKNKAGQTVTHRIVQTTIKDGEFFYQTKGDANNNVDVELISARNILGKEIFFVPEVGKISEVLKNPYGFIGLVVTPMIIFIGLELLNIKKEIVKATEKKILAQMGVT